MRDVVVHRIREEGRYPRRISSGATRQSLGENAVSSFKALVGAKLASRELEREQVEVLVKSQVLNRMTALGMPRSERVPLDGPPLAAGGDLPCLALDLRNNAPTR